VERPYLGRVPELPVSPAEQPRLWALVRELAKMADTRPPDEICLVPRANAAVSDKTRLLGLRVLHRRMVIGAPLLAVFTEDQLRAVLTHELAHYSNNDTRLAGITYRGRRSMLQTLARLAPGNVYEQSIAQAFQMYAKVYFKVSGAVSRRQEIAADEVAGRLVGGETTAAAYREVGAIRQAWELFMGGYAEFGWRTRYLPEHISDGFFALLASEERQLELDETRRNPGAEDVHSPYDTHPPMATRIATLEAMPPVPSRVQSTRPAKEILVSPTETLDTAMETLLTGKALSKGRLEWPELIDLGCRATAADNSRAFLSRASRVIRGDATLGTVLDALDTGRLNALAEPVDEDDDEYVEPAQDSVRTQLSTVVELALAEAGVAHWELSWSGPAEFVADEPYRARLAVAIENAVADEPDTAPLRALLTKAEEHRVRDGLLHSV
jgi:Zn-dependent protease with chaperone function